MGRSYLEAFFRHKYLLILPIIVGFFAGTFVAMQAPRAYLATASFWADSRIQDDTTIGTTGGQSPPSAGQVALLTQLLTTRQFMSQVLEVSPLAAKYRAADPVTADRMLGEVASTIMVGAPGPQLVTISVTRNDPYEATELAQVVVEQYESSKIDQTLKRAKARETYDRRQMESAERVLDETGTRTAQQQYTDAVAAYEASSVAVTNAQSNGIQVVDEADVAYPQARMKNVLMGAVGGAFAGVTISVILLVLLMARDRSVRSERDVESLLNLESVGSVPQVRGLGPSARGAQRRPSRPVGAGS